MTMDRTLRTHGRIGGARSVMTRAERIQRLIDEGTFDPEKDSPLGLPKIKVKHSKAGTKSKKAAEETPVEGAEPTEAAASDAKGEEKS